MANLIESMKIAALEAMEASKPCAVMFGTVESVSPLVIDVEQKMKLGIEQLILARDVTEYVVEMTVDHFTEDSLGVNTTHSHSYGGVTEEAGEPPHPHDYSGTTAPATAGAEDLTHNHAYVGRKKFIVHNQLVAGEQVILLRMQGGQKFVVIDRIGVM